jgi:hypothetical protein
MMTYDCEEVPIADTAAVMNCFITTGLDNVPSSYHSMQVPYDSVLLQQMLGASMDWQEVSNWRYVNTLFEATTDLTTSFYMKFECHNTTFQPVVQVSDINLVKAF